MTFEQVEELKNKPIGYRFKSRGTDFLIVGPVPEIETTIVRILDGKTFYPSEFYTGDNDPEQGPPMTGVIRHTWYGWRFVDRNENTYKVKGCDILQDERDHGRNCLVTKCDDEYVDIVSFV